MKILSIRNINNVVISNNSEQKWNSQTLTPQNCGGDSVSFTSKNQTGDDVVKIIEKFIPMKKLLKGFLQKEYRTNDFNRLFKKEMFLKGRKIIEQEFEPNSENLVKNAVFDKKGRVKISSEYSYTKEGVFCVEKAFNKDKSIKFKKEFKNNFLEKEYIYSSDGSYEKRDYITRIVSFFDEDGDLINEKEMK